MRLGHACNAIRQAWTLSFGPIGFMGGERVLLRHPGSGVQTERRSRALVHWIRLHNEQAIAMQVSMRLMRSICYLLRDIRSPPLRPSTSQAR